MRRCTAGAQGVPSGPPSACRTVAGAGLLVLLAAACGDAGFDRTNAREGSGHCESPDGVGELPGVLREASGVARDPRYADVFWAHNDSGNPAELFAIDMRGRLLGVVPLADAPNRDFEDIAAGPCGGESCLYLADIGDNLAVYPSITIHRLPLPTFPDGERHGAGTAASEAASEPAALPPVRPEASWRLVYPGGARDAESLAVDGEAGQLILITKGREGVIELYTAELDRLRAGSEAPDTLRRVGSLLLPIGQSTGQFVTGADLSPDGSRLAVRSYTTLYEFDWNGAEAFDTLAAPAHSPLIGALEAQGEGVAWDSTGQALVLVSEGRGGRPPAISRVRCPAPGTEPAEPGRADPPAADPAEAAQR